MRRLASVVVLGWCLLLVGCTGSPDSSETLPGDAREPGQLALVDPGVGTLRLAMERPESSQPDEVGLTDQGAVILADLLYDGLTEVDGATPALRPGLAARWSAGPDFRVWTFELDPEAGIGADLVVASLSALAGPSTGSAGGRSMAALTAGMRSVVALDDATVEIELDAPNAGFAWVLSGLPYAVVGEAGAPTGDYEIASDTDSGVRLELREDRLDPERPQPSVSLTWVDAPAEAYRLLVDGLVDGAVVDPPSVDLARRQLGVDPGPTTAVRYYVLNPWSPVLDDAARRAMLDVVEAEALVASLDPSGLVAVDGLVSPSLAGAGSSACVSPCASAGAAPSAAWPANGALTVAYSGEDQQEMAAALITQLTEVGIEAVGDETTPRELALAIVGGTTDLFSFGWVAPAGSVDAVLPPLLASDSPANVARISSEAVDELLDQASVTGDDQARWEVLAQAHQAALAEAKILPVAASSSRLVLASGVAGAVVRADGSLDLETGP